MNGSGQLFPIFTRICIIVCLTIKKKTLETGNLVHNSCHKAYQTTIQYPRDAGRVFLLLFSRVDVYIWSYVKR